jgi:restriction endonuclease Mrr
VRRVRRSVYCTASLLVSSRRPTKFPIIHPDLRLDYKVATHPSQEQEWKEKLYGILTQKLAPAAFERLVQRLLRESGFTHVEITGRSGDGGIDGRGIARMHGLLSFHVLFQCKRYKGAVGPGEIRDFRGAMVGEPSGSVYHHVMRRNSGQIRRF